MSLADRPSNSPSNEIPALQLDGLYARLFHHMLNAAAIIHGVEAHIVDVNPAFLSLYGYAREEVVNHTSRELNLWVNPRDRLQFLRLLQTQNQVQRFATRVRTRSGEQRHILLSAEQFELHGESYILATSEDITGQRQAEAALAASESRFQAVFDYAEAGIVCCHQDGRILNANPWLCDFLGWDEITLQQYQLRDLLTPSDQSLYWQERRQVWRQKQDASTLELRLKTLHRGLRWVHLSITLMQGTPTDSFYEIGVIADISDRKQIELQLRQQKDELRAVFKQLAIGVYQCNVAGQFTDVNQAFCSLVGYTRQDLVQQYFSQITHPDDQPGALELHTQLTQGVIESYSLAQRYICQDGSIRWVHVNVTQIHTTTAPTPFSVAIVEDISDRHQAELELRRSEEKFSKAFQASPDAIAITNLEDGRYVDVNDSFLNMLGFTRDEVIDKTEEDFEFGISAVQSRRLRLALQNNESIRDLELRGQNKQGELLNLLLTAEQIILNNQACILSFWRDITQQRRSEQLLRQQAEREHLFSQLSQQFAQLSQRIRRSLHLEDILNTAVEDIRKILNTSRVIIYRMSPQHRGVIEVESTASGVTSMLGQIMVDPTHLDGPTRPTSVHSNEIHTEENQAYYSQLLQQFEVQTSLVFPISSSDRLWGFLEVHHCGTHRYWQRWETDFLTQLADQLSIAIHQSELYSQLQEANHELQRLALLDGLTRIANRRSFNDQIQQEWRRLAREQQPLALIMCDIDAFKNYNDTYGHPTGDDCLIRVAQTLVRVSRRPADLVARYGGEEFAVILPNTDRLGAQQVAEQMRKAVSDLQIPHRASVAPYVTLSLGVAITIPQLEQSPEILIKAADDALYQAKQGGRNQVYLAPPGPPLSPVGGNDTRL